MDGQLDVNVQFVAKSIQISVRMYSKWSYKNCICKLQNNVRFPLYDTTQSGSCMQTYAYADREIFHWNNNLSMR